MMRSRHMCIHRIALGLGLALGLSIGCGSDERHEGPGELMVATDHQMTPERKRAFEAEFALATERFDYAQLDPAEVVQGRDLEHAHGDGRSFRRYVIDGREVRKDSHEALRPGRHGGRMWRIPYYYDPQHRFVVVRQIIKVDDRWELIVEDWVFMPADPEDRRALEIILGIGEVAGAEDMLGNSSAGRRLVARPPGFTTRVTPARGPPSRPASQAGQSGQPRKNTRAMSEVTRRQRSGLSVVPRPGMSARTVEDMNGNPVKIWGQSRSPSKTPGHDATMERHARKMARSGEYEYITIQRSWRTATGRVSKSRKIPDIIGVRRDGKVDAVEVRSKTDSERVLQRRLDDSMETLPPERQGETLVINP